MADLARRRPALHFVALNVANWGPHHGYLRISLSTQSEAAMTSDRVRFVAEYEDGRTCEFSIDRLTLSLGEYAAKMIARERQEMGDLPQWQIKAVRRAGQ